MKKKAKLAWRGAALAGAATGVFFLAKDKGRLFKQGSAGLKSLLGSRAAPAAAPAPATPPQPTTDWHPSGDAGRQPTPANGHVRDVLASNPPAPGTGENFTPDDDVHNPA